MQQHIICAGVDYDSAGRGFRGLSFREQANERRREILKKSPAGVDVSVTIFDVLAGTKEIVTVKWKDGKPIEARATEKRFEPVTRKSYKSREEPNRVTGRTEIHYDFLDGQPLVMSIVDLYRAIQEVGRNEPGTLFEVSVFSHANYKGPILVNSWEDPVYKEGASREMRDPDDKDGRAAKDFTGPNMDPQQLAAFTRAFHKDGHFWLWGCNFPDDIHKMLTRIERSGKSLGADEEVIDLRALTKEEIELFGYYTEVLALDREQLKKARCKFMLGDFKSALAGILKYTYPFKIAQFAKVRTIAALLGTYAIPDTPPKKLMAISGSTVRHVKFYKRHYGIKLDHERRNYGVLEPGIQI